MKVDLLGFRIANVFDNLRRDNAGLKSRSITRQVYWLVVFELGLAAIADMRSIDENIGFILLWRRGGDGVPHSRI
jgi:hypothetical protein